MTDRPITEPEPPDRELGRSDADQDGPLGAERPNPAEGEADEAGGPRPPRPSQAEGERDDV